MGLAIPGTAFVRCRCGILNRVPSHGANRIARCGSCKGRLIESNAAKIVRFVCYSGLFALSVGTSLAAVGYYSGRGAPVVSVSPPPARVDQPIPVQPSPPKPAVQNCQGIAQPFQGLFSSHFRSPLLAVLTIKVSPDTNYFVKLEDAITGKEVATFFLYRGTTLRADVPLGTFNLKYATGELWCGRKDLFGPGTRASKVDSSFPFERLPKGDRYTITDWTVELVLQKGGNLETSPIPFSDFENP